MDFPKNFIAASNLFCTYDKYVNAPAFRKSFNIDGAVAKAQIIICGLGFYDLYVNGTQVSKLLAPYISAPDDIIYYDTYDIQQYLRIGANTIGIILGNGMQNSFGGYIWKFDAAPWRGAPQVALSMSITHENGEVATIESDDTFLTNPSPIYFDDLRSGEYYDARLEQKGWNEPDFDDSQWTPAIKAPQPRGESRICEADPIVVKARIQPVSIIPDGDGFIYDFGINHSGVCELTITGEPGQTIVMEHGEHLVDGKVDLKTIKFVPDGYVQKDIYICKGEETETWRPRFTYHGFRYVRVGGITQKQATPNLLTYLVMYSDLEERGGFSCSNETANKLQELTRRSTLSNFHYFPTDCPHREKNGWTGDAAVSAEHTILNLTPEKSYREWLNNVRKAQDEHGALPGIVPTGGWGFGQWTGPAWDSALIYLPYFTYVYRGDVEILRENATAIFRYLHYLSNVTNDDGLLEIGLGDWCPPGRQANEYESPVILTDSIISMDICEKSAIIFDVLKWQKEKDFANSMAADLRKSIRAKLINFETMRAIGECQTSQAMSIFYRVFDENEMTAANAQLLRLIEEKDGHMDTGILGARVIFHVLTAMGQSDLAFHMITRPEYPSYGNWIARGATTLWENFHPEDSGIWSRNHHFFGDISGWFIKCIAGINFSMPNSLTVSPSFIKGLDWAEGYHICPLGKINVKWMRGDNDAITLEITVPDGVEYKVVLQDGWNIESDAAGKYIVRQMNTKLGGCLVKHFSE